MKLCAENPANKFWTHNPWKLWVDKLIFTPLGNLLHRNIELIHSTIMTSHLPCTFFHLPFGLGKFQWISFVFNLLCSFFFFSPPFISLKHSLAYRPGKKVCSLLIMAPLTQIPRCSEFCGCFINTVPYTHFNILIGLRFILKRLSLILHLTVVPAIRIWKC